MSQKKKLSFEEAFEALEKAAEALKNDGTTLEESLKYFEDGVKQYSVCNDILLEAKQKIFLFDRNTNELKEAEQMREDMFQKEFDRLKNLVNHKLYEYLPTEEVESKTVLDAMKYSLSAGGKRVRPILLLAAFQFCGGKEEEAIPYACAIEYIHTYSLIHDDLPAIDNDDMRRGKPTNHMVFGEAAAILAGDGLLNSAFEILFQDMERMNNLSDHNELMNRIRAASTIAHASGYQGMIGGQIADIESEQLKNCHVDKL